MTEYGPGDHWPAHPKPWWRDVIDLAKDRGWRLRSTSGHAWGTLICPESCKVVVFSTGRGGESAAKTARLRIERCSHGSTSPAAVADRHLREAERLTEAAAELIARRACTADVEELLELADEALGTAEQQALLDLIDALPPLGQETPERALDDAESHVRSAASQFAGLAAPAAKPLRARARAIRERIEELHRELGTRPHNVVRVCAPASHEDHERPAGAGPDGWVVK